MGVLGIVFEVLAPQRYRDVCHAHGRAGVTGVGLLDSVHCQCTNCTGHLLGIGHGSSV